MVSQAIHRTIKQVLSRSPHAGPQTISTETKWPEIELAFRDPLVGITKPTNKIADVPIPLIDWQSLVAHWLMVN